MRASDQRKRKPGSNAVVPLGLRQLRPASWAAALVLALSPTTATGAPLRNLVLIVVDTLRSDALGLYGNPNGTSPGIDAFGKQSVVFDTAWAQGTYTPSSYISYMSSTQVRSHGWDYELSRYPEAGICGWDDLELLPEVLSRHGFRRVALVSNPHLNPKSGFARGFEFWNGVSVDKLRGRKISKRAFAMDDEDSIREARRVLAKWHPDRRHFLYVHLMAPHMPLRPSPEARKHFGIDGDRLPDEGVDRSLMQRWRRDSSAEDRELSRAAYHASVWDADRLVKSLLTAIDDSKHRDHTAVVFTADHGEEIWEHGGYGHGKGVWDQLVRVPLVIRIPGRQPTRIADRVVGLVDLGPTLLQLLGIEERPRSWQGLDLFSKKRRVGVFSQRYDEVAITRDGRMKAIARSAPTGSSWRFFDLGSDPAEQSALDDPRQRTSLEQLYADWLAITPRVQRNPDEKPVDVCGVLPEGLQGEWMERLRELGYVE